MAKVVIGGGPSGIAAAACLGDATLLEAEAHAGGLPWPEVPVDRGVVEEVGGVGASIARHAGAAPVAAGWSRGLWCGGKLWDLPFSRRQLREMLPGGEARRALLEWTRTRAELLARDTLLGGGYEERSYRDWVVQRYGRSAYQLLYGPYGHKRFGDPEVATVNLARLHHGLVRDAHVVGIGASPAAGIAAMLEGTTVRPDCGIEGIELSEGRVSRVLTDEGAVEVDTLWSAAPLHELAEYLGDALSLGLRSDIGGLVSRHRIQVVVPIDGRGDLPGEVHVVDEAPFFRVTLPELVPGGEALAGHAVAHLSVADGDPLWSAADKRVVDAVVAGMQSIGLARASGVGRVLRLSDYDPAWHGSWHPAWTRVAAALQKMGIVLVGRAGMHRHIHLGQDLAYGDGLLDESGPDWHELARTLLDPPVKLDDLDVSITRFVER